MTRTSDPLVGSVLDGRYEVLERVARGGMATVYVANDLRLARQVALKVMHEGLSTDTEFTRKFDREARAAARLTHPHVVAVFDQGMDLGRPYIVMEYVPGTTLRRVISADAPLPPARALELMEPVLSALAAAHRAGLVHRDIKPENVLISHRGQVKVADFGLARAISGDTATATQGMLIGTVSYIPPELVQAGRADERSDVYSAGVVLFELLTGRKPHTGESPIQVAYAHCNRDIVAPSTLLPSSWRDSRSAVPPYLDALVLAAVSRDPARRPKDAGVLLDHLRTAARALERGIMNDARLDAEMWRTDDTATVPVAPVSRWVPREDATRPVTPISPVDLPTTRGAVGIPFYDAVEAEVTPLEALPAVPAAAPVRQPRRRTGSRRATRPTGARTRRRWAPVLALLMVLALAGTAGYTSWYLLAGQFTSVPALVGTTVADTKAMAEATHVRVAFTEEFSETVPRGTVIRTDPPSGTRVQNDAELQAFVSKGPERFAVPRLAGLGLDDARAALRSARLAVGDVTETYHESVAAGVVVSADVKPGERLRRDTAVGLTVSKGRRPIAVTSWVGKDAGAAKAALVRAGFRVTASGQHSTTVPAGRVISQTPAGGTGHRGDVVRLVVSQGPVMVTVPNTRQMKEADAVKVIEAAGFKVTVTRLENPAPLGIVSYTTPAASAQAPQGSTVTVYVV